MSVGDVGWRQLHIGGRFLPIVSLLRKNEGGCSRKKGAKILVVMSWTRIEAFSVKFFVLGGGGKSTKKIGSLFSRPLGIDEFINYMYLKQKKKRK